MDLRLVSLVLAGVVWVVGLGPAPAWADGGTASGTDRVEAAGERELVLGPAEGRPVYVLQLEGTVELGLSAFVDRALGEATKQGGAALIIQMNTLGGRLDAAVKIRDILLNSTIPTVTYIDRRAISAGALIALATDVIAVSDGGTMGAATPVQATGQDQKTEAADEKVISYMRKEMSSTAQAKGRDGKLAEAMVDVDVEIEGVSEKGKLLTVTTGEGMELGLFDVQAANLEELLTRLGLDDGPLVTVEQNWAEDVARFLTSPVVASLLMTIGFLGLLMELYTAGFGVTGVIGILSLLLFFFGHAVVNLAGLEEVIVFVVGLGLLLVEILVIPGFGVVGVLGIIFVVASLVLTLIGLPIAVSWSTGDLGRALTSVAASLFATIVAGVLLFRLLPRAGPFSRLVLTARVGGGREGDGGGVPPETGEGATGDEQPVLEEGTGGAHTGEGGLARGTRGVAVTSLHPWGKVRFKGVGRVEATTWDGSWVESGSHVEVVRTQGVQVVVRLVQSDE